MLSNSQAREHVLGEAGWLGSSCSSLHPWSSFCFHGSTKDNAAAAAASCCWERDYGFDLNISLIQFSVTGRGFSDAGDTGGSDERGLGFLVP